MEERRHSHGLVDMGAPKAFDIVEGELAVIASHGYVDKSRAHQVRLITDESVEKIDPDPDYGYIAAMAGQACSFLHVMQEKQSSLATLEDVIRAQEVVWVSEESVMTKQPMVVWGA